jgi:hypothetical protein
MYNRKSGVSGTTNNKRYQKGNSSYINSGWLLIFLSLLDYLAVIKHIVSKLDWTRASCAPNPNFPLQSQPDHPCPVLRSKIILFHFSEIHVSLCASCFPWRGGSRSSRTLEAGCGGREGAARLMRADESSFMDEQKRVVLIPRRWDQVLRDVSQGDGG